MKTDLHVNLILAQSLYRIVPFETSDFSNVWCLKTRESPEHISCFTMKNLEGYTMPGGGNPAYVYQQYVS